MDILQLSPEELSAHLQRFELPLRRRRMVSATAEEIVRYGSFIASSIESHAGLPRAMDHGRRHIDVVEGSGRSVKNGRLIIAATLSAPKGRFARSWHAPQGGLWGCLIHACTLTPQSSMLLSLAVGVAACEAVQEVGAAGGALRWVNDVLLEGAKVAGFLIESYTGPVYGEQFHLIGFGINVNNSSFPEELSATAVSLQQHLGYSLDLKAFALRFAAKLVWNIGLLHFVEAKDPDWMDAGDNVDHPVLARWKALSDSVGRTVVYGHDVVQKPLYRGTVTGVTADGGLQITLTDGSTLVEHSGEIRYTEDIHRS